MLTKRYLPTVKNLPALFKKIVDGVAPPKFTIEHLEGIGFTSSHDRAFVPLLKELKFLSADGTPTQRYHDYRDTHRSRGVMAQAVREAYGDLFHINAKPTESDRDAILGRFKSAHNATDQMAGLQAMTFFGLLKLSDLDAPATGVLPKAKETPSEDSRESSDREKHREHREHTGTRTIGLRYNIEIHLPATKDIEVYNAIFKSIKEHLVD